MIWYTIYTQSGKECLWCNKAAALIKKSGGAFHMHPLGLAELREHAARAKMTTVPIIYHGVRLVGGYDDLVKYLEQDR